MSQAEDIPFTPERQTIPVELNPSTDEHEYMLDFLKRATSPETQDALPPLEQLILDPEDDPHAGGKDDLLALCLTETPTTVKTTLEHFAKVEDRLEAAGLTHLIPFWKTYFKVTEKVDMGLENGKYDRPQDVMRTMPIFYHLAIHAITAYTQNQPQAMAPIWRHIIYSDSLKKASPVVQFALPMIAHIVNDLGHSLYLSGVGKDYKKDFMEVKNELREVAYERADELVPLENKFLQRAVIDPALALIHHYRIKAWDHGMEMIAIQRSLDLRQFISTAALSEAKEQRDKKLKESRQQTEKKALQHGRVMEKVAGIGMRAVKLSDVVLSSVKIANWSDVLASSGSKTKARS